MLAHLLLFGKVVAVVLRQTWVLFRLRIASIVHRWTYRAGPQPKNIVVVGASFAGYHTARCLVNSIPSGYRVVVIEKNSHFQLTWVLPRFCVVDGHDNKPFIPYGAYLKGPQGSSLWINDTVENIEPGKDGQGRVQTAAGEWINYEYLVLATGSSAELPSRVCAETKSDGMKALHNQRQKLTAARDIVVVGGGPAGIELAADAKAQFPRKNVTLIHSRKTLLNDGFGVKLHRAILKEMENLGVRLVLGEKPAIPDGETGDITLNEGSVHFDCLVRLHPYMYTVHRIDDFNRSDARDKDQTRAWCIFWIHRLFQHRATFESSPRCRLPTMHSIASTQRAMPLMLVPSRMPARHPSRVRRWPRISFVPSRATGRSSIGKSGGRERPN